MAALLGLEPVLLMLIASFTLVPFLIGLITGRKGFAMLLAGAWGLLATSEAVCQYGERR